MINSYDADKKCEEIASLWMERNIFLNNKFKGEYHRETNESLQKQGIDSYIKDYSIFKDNESHVIDEKSATSYIQTDLTKDSIQTFAFELDYKGQKGIRNSGWLYGDQFSRTEYYLLSWIWAEVPLNNKGFGDKESLTQDSILKVEALLLNKEKIWRYLGQYGLNRSNYLEKSNQCRKAGSRMYLHPDPSRKTPRIQYSSQLKEEPVNVLISKNHLEKMSLVKW